MNTEATLTHNLTIRLPAQKGPTYLLTCQSWNPARGLDPFQPLTYVTVKVYHRHVTPLLSRRPQRTQRCRMVTAQGQNSGRLGDA